MGFWNSIGSNSSPDGPKLTVTASAPVSDKSLRSLGRQPLPAARLHRETPIGSIAPYGLSIMEVEGMGMTKKLGR